jgi:catalase
MPENEAFSVPYNPFDLGKAWSRKDYPVTEVNRID